MNKIESQEGNPSVCGAFVRRCWLTGSDTGKNAGSHFRPRLWSLQAAPVATPGRSVHAGAWAALHLRCLSAERASVNAGTPARGATSRACACSSAPRLSGARACSSVKRGDCRHLPGSAWIRRNSLDLAQCPGAALLGTVGAMSHATQNAPRRTRRAPALPRWNARACTCPAVAKPAQECPARPDALPVLGRMRDNLAHAVRHDGCPPYAGRLDVDSTRSAALPLRPPDALGSPYSFKLCGSSHLTAWRRASWLRVRSVGHSAAGSVSPMQGQHEAQNHYSRASAGERRGPRVSVRRRRGILGSAARPQVQQAPQVQNGSQP